MEETERIQYEEEQTCIEPMAAPTKAQMRRTFSRLALGLCLGLLFAQLAPNMVTAIAPGFNTNAHAFLLGSLSLVCFTLPLMLLLTLKLPTRKPEKNSLSVGILLALVCISYAGMIAGNMVGILVNSVLSPGSMSLVNDLTTSSEDLVELSITLLLMAPVFEELVFRKILVDKVLPYGEWPAILFAGITFGLFHGNLTQFFYATLLGVLLAYVYIRTGNILYNIVIHACINLLGGILPTLMPAAAPFFVLLAPAGVALFFILRKRIHVEKNAAPGVGAAMFGNGGMILLLLISGLLMALVAYVMNHPELLNGLG